MAESRPIGIATSMAIRDHEGAGKDRYGPEGPGRAGLIGPDGHLRTPAQAEEKS